MNEPSRKQKIYGKTDKHGRFVLAGVRDGQYLITVSAPDLVSFPETVDLRSGEKLSLSVKLNFGFIGEIVMIESGSTPDRDNVPINIAPFPSTGPGLTPMQR